MYVWMKVSDDKYELPEAIADTLPEMAAMCGTTAANIRKQNAYRKKHGLHPLYVRVDIGILED